MRKLILGAALALILPGVAAAAPKEPTAADLARAACKTEKHDMGTKLFKQTYAAKSTAKAMRACVAKTVPVVEQEAQNASQACRAERDADREAFAEKYGTNRNNRNAFGKCVSTTTREATQEQAEDRVNAAKTCKAAKRDDADAFAEEWGSRRNAFGKCVSATAKAAAE
jgi:dephospho-CoA kinase